MDSSFDKALRFVSTERNLQMGICTIRFDVQMGILTIKTDYLA